MKEARGKSKLVRKEVEEGEKKNVRSMKGEEIRWKTRER